MSQKSSIRRLFVLFNSFQFFFSLLLWVPVFYEIQKRVGLSDAEIFKIQSVYYLFFCLLEIPTGLIADRLGYRLCLILGAFTLILANLCVPLFPSYLGFLSHFLAIALARSFVSGASSAYLYQTLHEKGALEEYKEGEGRARAYSLAGKVICWAAIGAIMEWHLMLPYWLTAMSAVISVFFAFKLPVPEYEKSQTSSLAKPKFGEVLGVLRTHPFLFMLMLQGVGIFVFQRIAQVNLYQPILKHKGFSPVTFGLVMSLMTIFEAIGAFRSKWVKKYLSDLNAVSVMTVIIAATFYMLSVQLAQTGANQILTLIAFSIMAYVVGISFPIQRQLMNDSIPDAKYRATLLSIESITDRAVNSWIASLLGAQLALGKLDSFLVSSATGITLCVLIIGVGLRILQPAKTQ